MTPRRPGSAISWSTSWNSTAPNAFSTAANEGSERQLAPPSLDAITPDPPTAHRSCGSGPATSPPRAGSQVAPPSVVDAIGPSG
jgi:hypothetical protein